LKKIIFQKLSYLKNIHLKKVWIYENYSYFEKKILLKNQILRNIKRRKKGKGMKKKAGKGPPNTSKFIQMAQGREMKRK
jgi:hypothetical protein